KLGKIIFARHITDSKQARRHERTGDRAEPADGHDNEDVNEIRERKRMIEPHDLDSERAAETRKPAAERKSNREHAIDIDAKATSHALVVDRGPYLRSEAREFKRGDQRGRDHYRNADQEEPVDAETPAQDRDGTAQVRRQVHGLLDGAVDVS